jgi:hypothetical protein
MKPYNHGSWHWLIASLLRERLKHLYWQKCQPQWKSKFLLWHRGQHWKGISKVSQCRWSQCTTNTFLMEQRTLKNVSNLNTNIYSYLETSYGQSSNLYLNVVHFFHHQSKLDICGSLRLLFSSILSNMSCSVEQKCFLNNHRNVKIAKNLNNYHIFKNCSVYLLRAASYKLIIVLYKDVLFLCQRCTYYGYSVEPAININNLIWCCDAQGTMTSPAMATFTGFFATAML